VYRVLCISKHTPTGLMNALTPAGAVYPLKTSRRHEMPQKSPRFREYCNRDTHRPKISVVWMDDWKIAFHTSACLHSSFCLPFRRKGLHEEWPSWNSPGLQPCTARWHVQAIINWTHCLDGHDYLQISNCYFTTGGLLPISSSWRQAPWGSRPETFVFILQLNYCGQSPYVTSSLMKGCVCLCIVLTFVKCT
jgi:hypothetical protein